MVEALAREIRDRGLLRAGDRVGVAVSGGADSVALLRALHGLRQELGVVLTALHFHHGIRGAEADKDEVFVAELAQKLGIECVIGRGDVPQHAKLSRQSEETAARELRYRFFESVVKSGAVDLVATAHTMDDQAETMLMRLIRGAGLRGLAGIHSVKDGRRYVRPMLGILRSEVEAYLRKLKQEWREDATNQEPKHFRNRLRHELLPHMKELNPNVVEVLARTASVAQAEEEYWAAEVARLLPLVLLPGKPTRGGGRRSSRSEEAVAFDLERLAKHPPAVQRRLLLQVLRQSGVDADSEHVESLLELARGQAKAAALPGGWRGVRNFRELRLEKASGPPTVGGGYEHPLPVPGEAAIEEIKLLVRARLEHVRPGDEGYNSGQVTGELLLRDGLTGPLTVRNWRTGDRFWAGNSKSPKKVQDVLQQLKVPVGERRSWPVVALGEEIIWVRGARQRPVRVGFQGQVSRLVVDASGMD